MTKQDFEKNFGPAPRVVSDYRLRRTPSIKSSVPPLWTMRGPILLVFCFTALCPSAIAQIPNSGTSGTAQPGASDPIPQPSRRLVFPADQIAAASPATEFTGSSPILTFNLLQPSADLSTLTPTISLSEVATSRNSISVSGRFLDPNLDQLAYAARDSNGQVHLQIFSGPYPAIPATSPIQVLNAGNTTALSSCANAQPYGDALAMAAGDLDNAVDGNGNRHDELVIACRDTAGSPMGYPASTDPFWVRLEVLDYSAWQGDTMGTYNPSDAKQNSYQLVETVQSGNAEVAVPYKNWVSNGKPLDVSSPNSMGVRIAIGDFDGDGQNEIALIYVSGNATDANRYAVSIYRYAPASQSGSQPASLVRKTQTFLGEVSEPIGSSNTYFQVPDITVAAGDFVGKGKKDALAIARVMGRLHCNDGCQPDMNEWLDVLDFDTSMNPSIVASQRWTGTNFSGGFPKDKRVQLTKVELASGLFLFNPSDNITAPADSLHYNYTRRELALIYNRDKGITLYPLSINEDTTTKVFSIDPILAGDGFVMVSNQNINTFSVAASQFRDISISSKSPTTPNWSLAVSYWGDESNKQTSYNLSLYNFGFCSGSSTTFCETTAPTSTAILGGIAGPVPPVTLPLAAYDYAGNSTILGAPSHITVSGVLHYDTILGEPPKLMFVDGGSVHNITNFDTFQTSLTQTTGEASLATKTQDFSWGAGASVDVSASATIKANAILAKGSATTTLNAKIAYDHNSTASSIDSQLSQYQWQIDQKTPFDDDVTFTTQTFDIWEYRVYGPGTTQPDTNAFVDFVVPGPFQTQTVGGTEDDEYQPPYENNNLLTYPQYDVSDPTQNPDIGPFSVLDSENNPVFNAAESLTNSQEIGIDTSDGSTTLTLSSSVSKGSSVSATDTLKNSDSLKQSISGSADIPVAGGGTVTASVTVSANESWSWANAAVSTKTLNASMVVGLETGILGNQDYPYEIWPALYVTKDGGTLKYTFGLDPTKLTSGSTATNFAQVFGLPDAALNLARRFAVTYPTTTTEVWAADTSPTRKWMRDLWLVDHDSCDDSTTPPTCDPVAGGIPHDGQPVDAQVRVYNLSTQTGIGQTSAGLKNAPLEVELQIIGVDSQLNEVPFTSKCPAGGPLAKDQFGNYNGRCVVGDLAVPIALKVLESQIVSVPFNTSGFGPAKTDDEPADYNLYVVLDPRNKIQEHYEGEAYCAPSSANCPVVDGSENNEGYNAVSIAAPAATSYPGQVGAAPDRPKRDLAMAEDSLEAMDHRRGLQARNVEAYAGRPLRIRVGAHTDHGRNQYDHILVWEAHDQNHLLAFKKVHVNSKRGGFAWFTWTPRSPGVYTLQSQIVEDGDDTSPGNNKSSLVVKALPVPPAARR